MREAGPTHSAHCNTIPLSCHDIKPWSGAPYAGRRKATQSQRVMFLLETTWLALAVWAHEHGALLASATLAGVQWRTGGRSSINA